MNSLIYELKNFYCSRAGRLVRRLVSAHLRDIWPDLTDKRVAGYGYAVPYLRRGLRKKTERCFAIMPPNSGAHFWPPDSDEGLVCFSAEEALPLESESIDCLMIMHGLEYAQDPDALFKEAWRVLKSNGRLLVIVPNRLGFWARADWTPFGHGTPYTAGQISDYLKNNLFVHERTERALFMPPFRSFLMLRAAYVFESIGCYIFPGLAGVHLIEASKQIYAGIGVKSRTGKTAKDHIVVGNTVPTG